LPWWPAHLAVASSEQSIAFQVNKNALEQMSQIEQAIAAPLEHLDLVVQAFHKTAGVAVHKVIGDLGPPVIQRVEKGIKAGQAAVADALLPGA